MTTHTLLSRLGDAELLRHAYNEHNSLTVTTLEVELLARFEKLIEVREEESPCVEFFAERDINDVEAFLTTLGEAEIETVDELKARLTLADQFDEIANDAGDVISRLQSLIESTTKE